jgi:unsaturated rhamnogalacturonyl hydrolase
MKSFLLLFTFLSLLAVPGIAISAPAADGSEPRLAKYPPAPEYPVPYVVPKVEDVKAALDRIEGRLSGEVRLRVVDTKTREPITDLSTPTTGAILDRGAEWKFAPLDYPMGVIEEGLLRASEVTGDPRYADFVARMFQYFSDNLDTFTKWGADGEMQRKNPFRHLVAPESLDACGAVGAAMVKARQDKVGPDMKLLIDRSADYVSKGQYRLEDGTLARVKPREKSVWADDLYMSVPLLAQMGKLTGETRYFDDASKQILQISRRLLNPETALYAHAWNEGNGSNHPNYYWGRANGWCMMAMAELLDVLPENHPDRPEILKLFQTNAKGLANVQSGSGLWHQLLNRPDTYLESSCTGMFTFAIARGVDRGWLDPLSYGPVALAGWDGLVTRIKADGAIEGTCIGTNYGNDPIFYANRPATDDVHGYGPALLAGAEIIKLLKNKSLVIRGGGSSTGSGGSPISVERRSAVKK